ncbi:hypothetical protein RCL1_002295 [Eukaryota sp. TZLM3-RCL]
MADYYPVSLSFASHDDVQQVPAVVSSLRPAFPISLSRVTIELPIESDRAFTDINEPLFEPNVSIDSVYPHLEIPSEEPQIEIIESPTIQPLSPTPEPTRIVSSPPPLVETASIPSSLFPCGTQPPLPTTPLPSESPPLDLPPPLFELDSTSGLRQEAQKQRKIPPKLKENAGKILAEITRISSKWIYSSSFLQSFTLEPPIEFKSDPLVSKIEGMIGRRRDLVELNRNLIDYSDDLLTQLIDDVVEETQSFLDRFVDDIVEEEVGN